MGKKCTDATTVRMSSGGSNFFRKVRGALSGEWKVPRQETKGTFIHYDDREYTDQREIKSWTAGDGASPSQMPMSASMTAIDEENHSVETSSPRSHSHEAVGVSGPTSADADAATSIAAGTLESPRKVDISSLAAGDYAGSDVAYTSNADLEEVAGGEATPLADQDMEARLPLAAGAEDWGEEDAAAAQAQMQQQMSMYMSGVPWSGVVGPWPWAIVEGVPEMPYGSYPFVGQQPWGWPAGEQDDAQQQQQQQQQQQWDEEGQSAPNRKAAAKGEMEEPWQREQEAEEARSFMTLMLRNVPNSYKREMVWELLNDKGFRGRYDFVYIPFDWKRATPTNKGFGFINFRSHIDALSAWNALEGFNEWKDVSSNKKLEFRWASKAQQGYKENVERYQNSPMMHEVVGKHFKPAIFDTEGMEAPFPKPTKKLRLPRQREGPPLAVGNGP